MATADDVLAALTSYNVKEEGRGKYRFNSPFRAGADGMTCTLTVEDGEHGAWIDHKEPSDKGSLYDLAKRLGVAPDRAQIATTKRPYGGLSDYAEAHGVPAEELKRWGWRETVFTEKNGDKRPALTYPTRAGYRWRFLDGNRPYYKSETGYKRTWYGMNETCAARLRDGMPLVICNGEISTVAGQYWGLAAISLPGGESDIPDAHIQTLRAWLHEHGVSPSIIVALDCDHKGRMAARGMLSTLKGAGFTARAVDLKLSSGGDLADYARLHTIHTGAYIEKLPDVAEEREPPPAALRWRRTDLDGVLSMPLIEWLVPHVIPRAGLCVVYGPSGTHKSFYTLDIALTIALTSPIIYIAAEGQLGYRQRTEAWIQHHQKRPPSRNAQFILGSVNLFEQSELEYLAADISSVTPALVVVDTLAMVSGDADENSTRDMNRIVNGCKWMSNELKSAIVLVHHTNAEGRVERGNKALRGAADTMIRLTMMDEYIAVDCTKAKDTAQFTRRYLRPLVVTLPYLTTLGEPATSLVLEAVDSTQVESQMETTLTDLQLQVLKELQVESDSRVSDLAYRLERNSGVISNILRKLTTRGYLVQDGSRRTLTDKAIEAIQALQAADTDGTSDGNVIPLASGDSTPYRVVSPPHISQPPPEVPESSGINRLNRRTKLFEKSNTHYEYE